LAPNMPRRTPMTSGLPLSAPLPLTLFSLTAANL
jgi:hypothetical protein